MRAIAFWKTITVDRTDFLDRLLTLLIGHGIRFCVVGGQAVNAYVEPVVSLDLDLAIAAQIEDVLRGKVWAAMDSARRASKRQKDLADIARPLEAYPYLRAHVPEELLTKLL